MRTREGNHAPFITPDVITVIHTPTNKSRITEDVDGNLIANARVRSLPLFVSGSKATAHDSVCVEVRDSSVGRRRSGVSGSDSGGGGGGSGGDDSEHDDSSDDGNEYLAVPHEVDTDKHQAVLPQGKRNLPCNGENCSLKGYRFGRCVTETHPIRDLNLNEIRKKCVFATRNKSMTPSEQRNLIYFFIAKGLFSLTHSGTRAELPVCVVGRVRFEFPNKKGVPYTGFKNNSYATSQDHLSVALGLSEEEENG